MYEEYTLLHSNNGMSNNTLGDFSTDHLNCEYII